MVRPWLSSRPATPDRARTPPGQRTVLVIDLAGEPLAPLRALEEILLCLGTWEDDDRRDLGTGAQPLRLTAPLVHHAPS